MPFERMRIHFDHVTKMADNLRVEWDYGLREDGMPMLAAFVLVDHVWPNEAFQAGMEVVVTCAPIPAAGALNTGRNPPAMGIVRGRLVRLLPSPERIGWKWLAIQVRFNAKEGPEEFIDEQTVQFPGDDTPMGGKGYEPLTSDTITTTDFGFFAGENEAEDTEG